MVEREVANPVLLPALFVFLVTEWFFLAVADGTNAIGGNALSHQGLFHGFRPAGPEGDVVFLGSAVVSMPFDKDLDVGMMDEKCFVSLDRWQLVTADRVLVVVEEHILDILAEQFLIRG